MLSEIFRAKMRTALERAGLARAVDPAVWQQRWTVHVQQMGRGDHAVRYLARYVYRVAVTNERLQRTADGHVTLRYLHARTHETRSLTLPVAAFLARFLPHVLPRGFAKIRAYGLLSASRAAALARVRGLLDLDAARTASTTAEALRDTSHTSPVDGVIDAALRCAACHRGALCLVLRVPRSRAPP